MFNKILGSIKGAAQGLFSSFNRPTQQQPQQQMVSPLPDAYSKFTRPAGMPEPTTPVSRNIPAPRPTVGPVEDFSQDVPATDQYTHFGMSGEMMGALRDVNGITWQHQGGDNWTALRNTGESNGNPLDNLFNAVVDPVSKALQEWNNRLTEFDKNSPFSFDEAQAKASASERLNPYYDATLNEYITGWRRSSSRSTEDMTRTVGELNADATKLSDRERFATQEAIRSSEEGNAGSGLFFSGKRERETGVAEVGGLQAQGDITSSLERGIGTANRANTRTQEDLALQKARTTRLTEAERTTALQTDIANQNKEARVKRELEKLQFTGQRPGGNFGNQLSLENNLFGMYG